LLDFPEDIVKSPPFPLELLPTAMLILPAAPSFELDPVARKIDPVEPPSLLVTPVDKVIAPEYVDDSPFAPPVDTVTEPLPSPLLSLSDVLIDIAPVTPELESPVVIEMEPPFFSPTPF